MTCTIFGDGPLRVELEHLLPSLPFVSYEGFQPKETIIPVRKTMDMTLMPSLFLETFGLSALESLQLGVPVVGFAKGGLTPFIFPEYRLEENTSFVEQMSSLIQRASAKALPERKQEAIALAATYAVEQWLKNFYATLDKPSGTILLVSDYICPLGGVESYLMNVKNILEQE